MAKLQVQEYLLTHTLNDLIKDHGIYPHFSKDGRKFTLNYDQIEAKDSDPLSQECRGLILAYKGFKSILTKDLKDVESASKAVLDTVVGETKIVAFPMRRFFNYGQGACAVNLQDPNLRVLDKIDGTCIIVYRDTKQKQWHVATRSVPEADIQLKTGETFRQLFEMTVKNQFDQTFDQFTHRLDPQYTYVFEMVGPVNQVTIYYPKMEITLLSVRSLKTLKELPLDGFDFPKAKSYAYSSIDSLVTMVNSLSGKDYEGVVVVDSNFNRLKVKNAEYLLMSGLASKLKNDETLMELILMGKEDDAVSLLHPDRWQYLQELKSALARLITEYDSKFKLMKEMTETKKEFAIRVMKLGAWQSAFFTMYDKNLDMKGFIDSQKKDGEFNNTFIEKIFQICLLFVEEKRRGLV